MAAPTTTPAKESKVDVLIVGAGPAGYMAALWFARLGIKTKIIDKRSTQIFTGQADGLQPRVLEVFETFGFVDRAIKEVAVGYEACFYEPDENGLIRRVDKLPEGVPGISRFNGSVIHQGRIETWLSDAITEFSNGTLNVERPYLPQSLEIEAADTPTPSEYPVKVVLKKLPDDNASPEQFGHKVQNGLYRQFGGDQQNPVPGAESGDDLETVHAKYVLGCDGAHSWVRKQLGIEHKGETTDYVWGVLDIVPVTDFPDIRKRCSIHSKDGGSIMVIPREDGIVRFYIQLREGDHIATVDPAEPTTTPTGEKKPATRVDRTKLTAEHILATAQKIMHPYSLEVAEMHWFTAYQIGQRVATAFQKDQRVFIAGDACHTHSPKAGQGMNVSMMDTFNLAWKLAYVIKGLAKPSILPTYESERMTVAQDLIAYDQKLSRLFSSKPGEISTDEFRRVIDQGSAFTTGCTVNYQTSLLIDKPAAEDNVTPYYSPLATKLAIGMRLPDTKLVMQSDARPWYLNQRLPSTGQFRVLVFIGDYAQTPALKAQMEAIGAYLAKPENSLQRLRTDGVLQTMLIHASPQAKVEWDDFPLVFRPRDERGVMDYWLVMADTPSLHETTGNAYETYGIEKGVGALVVLRPDGYVAKVVEPTVEGVKGVWDWLSQFVVGLTPTEI
ncbi:FAD binding domain-containing protein [Cercophora scortea]|uniref:FAD binding domain-containing protein n=1 Tax=Cercophora scortea TaxID=314031 RepID=A0AAE0MCP7_9PEZI|nr:FAD binding domain-containing protein [Cercophora scortea]